MFWGLKLHQSVPIRSSIDPRSRLSAFAFLNWPWPSFEATEVIADLGGGFGAAHGKGHSFGVGYSPCLTRTRCAAQAYYSFENGRKLRVSELFKLQGVPPKRLCIPQGVSERQVRMMIGNSFTVPVVADILDRALYATGLTKTPMKFAKSDGGDPGNAWPPHEPAAEDSSAATV